MINCKACGGSGRCSRCEGKGVIVRGFFSRTERDCPVCSAMGRCCRCKGMGGFTEDPYNIVRIRCPMCDGINTITSLHRPLEMKCECGATLLVKR